MRGSVTLSPRMKQWVARTRVIATLLLAYLQVCEYGSFHFYVRRLLMRLSVISTLTPRSPSTKATKGVKCQRSLRQVLSCFLFFLCPAFSRHFSGVLYW